MYITSFQQKLNLTYKSFMLGVSKMKAFVFNPPISKIDRLKQHLQIWETCRRSGGNHFPPLLLTFLLPWKQNYHKRKSILLKKIPSVTSPLTCRRRNCFLIRRYCILEIKEWKLKMYKTRRPLQMHTPATEVKLWSREQLAHDGPAWPAMTSKVNLFLNLAYEATNAAM